MEAIPDNMCLTDNRAPGGWGFSGCSQDSKPASLEAFVCRSLELIEQMCALDEEVDDLYDALNVELKEFMKKDPTLVDQAVELILISRHLERIADHITNVGERVYYVETGAFGELQ